MVLDQVIRHAHRMRLGRCKLHPYLLFLNAGTGAAILFVSRLEGSIPGISFHQFALAFGAAYLGYELVFLRLKRCLFDMRSRSFLQDGVLWFFPAYGLTAWLLGASVASAMDMLALVLPLWMVFIRIGCFLGGCCYGVPSPYGVSYPAESFQPLDGCQRFSPGPDPGCRVFPIQLVESAANAALFLLLLQALPAQRALNGLGLPLYLTGYCFYRFISDFFRAASSRPRYGRFSEAQLVAAALLMLSAGWIAISLGWPRSAGALP